MRNVAILLCGGSGSRFGGETPKQFTKLAGKLIIEYTVERFENNSNIDEIIIATKASFINFVWDLVRKNSWQKVVKVINGGVERFDSTYSALQTILTYPDNSNILVHDGVRPFVNDRIINDCLTALITYDAVDVTIDSSDTLVKLNNDACIEEIPERKNMRRGQTPQGFKLSCLKSAYDLAKNNNIFNFTCDCSVVKAFLPHIQIKTINGDLTNIKITNPIDLFIAEKFIQHSHKIKIDNINQLFNLKDKVIVIFGGSSGIGLEVSNIAKQYNATIEIASRSFNNIDITNIDCLKNFLAFIYQKHSRIDYIINTAGLLIKKPLSNLNESEINDLININYKGCINIALASKQYLAESKGMLLNFTSSSYTRGRSNYAIYSSANAAVVNLTQALAEEWGVDNIRVNCINPERTATPMRVNNFGIEPLNTLLSAETVAQKCLHVLMSNTTGLIFDIRKDQR